MHQPERVRRPEVVEQLRAMAPEAMVVVGYGQIIPQSILDIPPHGIINVHASLLPKYRGAAPIQWAIARGETRTGVTTMRINAGLDTGDMLLKWETEIGAEETAVELGARLAVAGADLLVRTLAGLADDSARAAGRFAGHLRADSEEGRRAHRLAACPAREILNRIRGFAAVAGLLRISARTKRFMIWKARPAEREACRPARCARCIGKLVSRDAATESIELLEVQLEGKKRMHGGGVSEWVSD